MKKCSLNISTRIWLALLEFLIKKNWSRKIYYLSLRLLSGEINPQNIRLRSQPCMSFCYVFMSVPLASDCQYALHIKICFAFILLLIVDNLVFTNPFCFSFSLIREEMIMKFTNQSEQWVTQVSQKISSPTYLWAYTMQ